MRSSAITLAVKDDFSNTSEEPWKIFYVPHEREVRTSKSEFYRQTLYSFSTLMRAVQPRCKRLQRAQVQADDTYAGSRRIHPFLRFKTTPSFFFFFPWGRQNPSQEDQDVVLKTANKNTMAAEELLECEMELNEQVHFNAKGTCARYMGCIELSVLEGGELYNGTLTEAGTGTCALFSPGAAPDPYLLRRSHVPPLHSCHLFPFKLRRRRRRRRAFFFFFVFRFSFLFSSLLFLFSLQRLTSSFSSSHGPTDPSSLLASIRASCATSPRTRER